MRPGHRLVWSVLLLLLLPPLRPCLGQAAKAVAKEGTPVLLVTEEKLVSGETPEGSTVPMHVDRDVLGPEGQVLIPRGAPARGTVVKSEGAGFFGAAGELNFTLDSVKAADDTRVPLRAFRNATGDDAEGGVIAGAVLLSVFFVFMSGDDVEIPPGTIFTGYVADDTPIPAPGPSKLTAADRKATAALRTPAAGAQVQMDDEVVFSCETSPPDDEAYVRLYLDDAMVAAQKGNLSSIKWNTERDEALRDKVGSPGQHTAVAEVTFSTGRIVRSEPVKFSFKD